MYRVPLGNWSEHVVSFLQNNVQPLFDAVTTVVNGMYNGVDWVLGKPEPLLLAAILAVVAFWLRGPLSGVLAFLGLALIDSLQLWTPAMQTLSQVIVASVITILLAVPLGIWSARSRWGNALLRPVLDLMQTMPAFVYLIPGIFFFGTGIVPAAIATIVFSMPPGVRMTDLGIRQVDGELVEAAEAFGTTPRNTLLRVQLPLALPTILAGLNQVIMLALSMVVISAMVGAPGLGQSIYTAISQVNVGMGVEGGTAVVILAMYLDRMTAALGERVSPLGRRALAKANSARGLSVLRYRPASAVAGIGVLVIALVAGGLNLAQDKGSDATPAASSSTDVGHGQSVNLGYINWDEDVASSYLWQDVLQQRGFKPNLQLMDVGALYASMAKGSTDFELDSWLPTTHASYWAQYQKDLVDLGSWYGPTSLEIAVPSYVTDVRTLADLKGKASEFGGKITGIEPGAGEMKLLQTKVLPGYGLDKDYQLTASSTASMLADLDRSVRSKTPIAVALWSPHWAYSKYHLTKLTDPQGLFGAGDRIHTLANKSFPGKFPQISQWLKSFRMAQSDLTDLENAVHAAGTGHEQQAVQSWLAKHPGLVDQLAPVPGGSPQDSGHGKTVTLGYFPWDEDIAASYLWDDLLTRRGYKVNLQQFDVGSMFTAMSNGQVDFELDGWLPHAQSQYWAKYHKDLVNLGAWYSPTSLEITVPSYVKDVHSLSDLAAHASEFGGRIIGIEPGTGEMSLVKSSVLPAYGLDKNFTLVAGSSPAMLADLERAYAKKQPIAVVLWSPHWAYSKYSLTKLADPKGAFGAHDQIDSLANKDFPQKFPQIAGWLKNFHLTEAQLGSLENDIQQAGQGNEAKAVQTWLAANPGVEDTLTPGT
ncbi:ABC transporter permease/substrate binding protein [Streptacidiphilus carbonis]|uniref:ABC transporter permease/substrate binding protein n=1 Tax=Streptacidiphilus carbonis TaxID=105422 RepID=UPI0005A910F2|nr:ABC transporter permease/substrate binding protein [Streptacidiphilus carbonis]